MKKNIKQKWEKSSTLDFNFSIIEFGSVSIQRRLSIYDPDKWFNSNFISTIPRIIAAKKLYAIET